MQAADPALSPGSDGPPETASLFSAISRYCERGPPESASQMIDFIPEATSQRPVLATGGFDHGAGGCSGMTPRPASAVMISGQE
jgi:hypothetical protein